MYTTEVQILRLLALYWDRYVIRYKVIKQKFIEFGSTAVCNSTRCIPFFETQKFFCETFLRSLMLKSFSYFGLIHVCLNDIIIHKVHISKSGWNNWIFNVWYYIVPLIDFIPDESAFYIFKPFMLSKNKIIKKEIIFQNF